jgi:molybdopterin-guanine dinucleotide biosynthesis adapter protein
MRIISLVAVCSNSGKTTLIEKIIPILRRRGRRVAVVKHASKGFDFDRPGKDSWRFQQAGAESVVLVGPGRMVAFQTLPQDPSQEEIIRAAGDADIVLFEGFKQHAGNKIEVYRSAAADRPPLCLGDPSFLALVSDRPFAVSIPRFDLDDADAVAEYILSI